MPMPFARLSAVAVAALVAVGAAHAQSAAARGSDDPPVPLWLDAARTPAASELPARAMKDLARAGRFNDAVLRGARIAIELPDGRVLRVTRQREMRGNRGEQSWVGEVEGMPGSVVSLTLHGGQVAGFIHHGTETWEFQPAGNGGQMRLFRVDVLKLPGEPPLPTAPADTSAGTATSAAPAPATAAEPVIQDLLIVYTAAAAAANGGAAALESMALNAVAAANVAYGNSRINLQLNVVGLRQITYTETGDMGTSLSRLQSASDGFMDDVHTVRSSTGADLVTLLSTDGGSCGIGYLLSSTNGNPAYGFNVVSPSCFSNHTLAHEIGHNQGNHHDRANGGSAFYPYAYGFRSCDHPTVAAGQSFRTVMGYPCSGVPRVNYFSNPQVYYNNAAPMGIAYEADPANAADNARSMNQTAAAVAAYRTPPGTVTLPAAPSAMTVGLDAAGTTATLRWADNAGNEQGFVVQRSAAGGAFVDRATLGANATTFSDTGLAASTAYSWRVRAYNAAGASAYSNTVSLSTPAPAVPGPTVPLPAAPASASVSVASGVSTVSWSNVDGETRFDVLREQLLKSGTWGNAVTTAVAADTLRLAQNLSAGTWRWRVRAVNAAGASAYTTAACSGTGCNADGSLTLARNRGK